VTSDGKESSVILLSHGGGGKQTRDLIRDLFLPEFDNPILSPLRDSAVLNINSQKVVFTTDTYVVKPLFFPGGDIGRMAVFGTINDISVMGAGVAGLSAGFVIEEGFEIEQLRKIIISMREAAETAGVSIVTGDTKVVERGSADKVFINTSGVGLVIPGGLSENPIAPGDRIVINGTPGDHGIAVLSAREELDVKTEINSDAAPLSLLILPVLEKFPGKIKLMRDATRGGFATVLNEFLEETSLGITVYESRIPVKETVKAVCEILGFDPLYLANEGKVVMVIEKEAADEIVEYMKKLPYGADAAVVGEITEEYPGRVVLHTTIGGRRVLDMMLGEQLPRIC
jgi:hydrogenase expression/formation protein HypE